MLVKTYGSAFFGISATTITVKGFDLCKDILGKLSLGDMAFLELTDRLPNAQESAVFNAIAVALVEHGITPSSIAARGMPA